MKFFVEKRKEPPDSDAKPTSSVESGNKSSVVGIGTSNAGGGTSSSGIVNGGVAAKRVRR